MIKFRRKLYGEVSEVVVKAVKNNPFSVGTFILSGGNLVTNLRRHQTDKKYQSEQLDAMRDLTSTLTGVNKTLKKTTLPTSKKEVKDEGVEDGVFYKIRNRKYFSNTNNQKNFSILGDAIRGANIGAVIGTTGNIFTPKKLKGSSNDSSYIKRAKRKYNDLGSYEKRLILPIAGAVIGAGLGALYGIIKKGDSILSRNSVNKNRLMPEVINNLKKLSFKNGVDYTKEPKVANQLRTRVCVVITRINGDLKLLVNTISDPKLKDISEETIKNIPNTSAITKTSSNNYNDISITTISDGSADAGLITGICEKFIRSGYPVYLIEVG